MAQKLKPLLVASLFNNFEEKIMKIIYPLTIYYDASCPLCAAEMHTIKETDFENKLTLVTDNSKHFDSIAGIKLENWFKRK